MPEFEEESLDLNETLARICGFLLRSRWWILVPFCGVSLGTIAVLSLLPNRYTSSATLLVVQQQVPQRYVVPNSTTDVTSALQAMKQEVLSRTQLLRMINDFSLYPMQRKHLAPEELIAMMLSNIDLVPINENSQQQKDIDTFRISFTTENALLAQQVTTTLTSLFINEYLRAGAEQSNNTTSFLHQQVGEKGKELEAQEERLRDFKLRHIGELPEQQQGNLGILTGLQGQLQNTMAGLNRAKEQRAFLQAQLDATPKRRVSESNSFVASTSGNPNPTPLMTPLEASQNDLARLLTKRSDLRSKGYTFVHPDVQRNEREIVQAEAIVKRLQAAAPPPEKPLAPTPITSTRPTEADDPVVAQLKSNLEANRIEIQNLTNDEARLKAEIAQYTGRINQTPVREQEEASILRDTEVLRAQYNDLLKKEQESQLATNLEKQQGGQQFRLIDPASLPSVPSSPKRLKMSLGGLAGGLALGLALAIWMEMRNTSFRTEREITKELAPPFVLGIPLLSTPVEERRRKWLNLLQWAGASAMLLVVMGAEFMVYRHG